MHQSRRLLCSSLLVWKPWSICLNGCCAERTRPCRYIWSRQDRKVTRNVRSALWLSVTNNVELRKWLRKATPRSGAYPLRHHQSCLERLYYQTTMFLALCPTWDYSLFDLPIISPSCVRFPALCLSLLVSFTFSGEFDRWARQVRRRHHLHQHVSTIDGMMIIVLWQLGHDFIGKEDM